MNDRFGHDAGGKVLAAVARRLRRAIRISDVAARLGGDEFGVILEKPSLPEDAPKIERHIIGAIAESFVVKDVTVSISASICAAVTGRGVARVSNLVVRADRMPFAASIAGRGHVALDVQDGAGHVDNSATGRGDIS